jgi:hypothetical protein
MVWPDGTHVSLPRLLIRAHSRHSRAEKPGRGRVFLAYASGYQTKGPEAGSAIAAMRASCARLFPANGANQRECQGERHGVA